MSHTSNNPNLSFAAPCHLLIPMCQAGIESIYRIVPFLRSICAAFDLQLAIHLMVMQGMTGCRWSRSTASTVCDSPALTLQTCQSISLIGRDSWLYISDLLSLRNYAIFNIEYGGVKSMLHRMGELEPFHARDKAHVSLCGISRPAWYFRFGGKDS